MKITPGFKKYPIRYIYYSFKSWINGKLADHCRKVIDKLEKVQEEYK